MKLRSFYKSILLLCLSSNLAVADINADINKEVLLAPKCFMDNNSFQYNELAFDKQQDLVLFEVDTKSWWQQLPTINRTCGKLIMSIF